MVSSGRSVLVHLVVVALSALAAVPVASAAKPKKAPRAHLAAFDSCQALVGYAHRYAGVTGGGVGVPVRALGSVATLAAPMTKTTDANVDSAPAAALAPAASGTGASSPEFSTTNVQEVGIDEPDVVKTDGQHVYVAADRTLRVIDVTGDAPRLVGSRRWLCPSAADPRHACARPLDGVGADRHGRRAGTAARDGEDGDRADPRPLDGPVDRGRPDRSGRAEGRAHDDARRRLRRCPDGGRDSPGRRQLDADDHRRRCADRRAAAHLRPGHDDPQPDLPPHLPARGRAL
jgi:hypothetical protein